MKYLIIISIIILSLFTTNLYSQCVTSTFQSCSDCTPQNTISNTTPWLNISGNYTRCITNTGVLRIMNNNAQNVTIVNCGVVQANSLNFNNTTTIINYGVIQVNVLSFNSQNSLVVNYGTIQVSSNYSTKGAIINQGILNVGANFQFNGKVDLINDAGSHIDIGANFNTHHNSTVSNAGNIDVGATTQGKGAIWNCGQFTTGGTFISDGGQVLNDGLLSGNTYINNGGNLKNNFQLVFNNNPNLSNSVNFPACLTCNATTFDIPDGNGDVKVIDSYRMEMIENYTKYNLLGQKVN